MNREGRRDDLAQAIWAAWITWARRDPSLPRLLRAPWNDLPDAARDAAYRMADAALAVLYEAGKESRDRRRPVTATIVVSGATLL